MKRMDSANLLAGPAALKVQPGQYSALVLRIDCLTGAAAPTAATWGNITAYWRNRPFYSVSAAATQVINEMDLGFVEATYGALGGNPTQACFTILSSRVPDGNIIDVQGKDECEVRIDLSGVAAGNVASGTVTLYGIEAEGSMMYLPEMLSQTPNVAASTVDVIQFGQENISHLYMVTLTNVASVRVERDGQVAVDCVAGALQALSNLFAKLEAAYTAGVKMDFHGSGAMSEALSDDVKFNLTAGAGGAATPVLVPVSLDFTPDALERSSAYVAAKADQKFKRKDRNQKARPLRVARKLTTG
jgi:hypothetical protein